MIISTYPQWNILSTPALVACINSGIYKTFLGPNHTNQPLHTADRLHHPPLYTAGIAYLHQRRYTVRLILFRILHAHILQALILRVYKIGRYTYVYIFVRNKMDALPDIDNIVQCIYLVHSVLLNRRVRVYILKIFFRFPSEMIYMVLSRIYESYTLIYFTLFLMFIVIF